MQERKKLDFIKNSPYIFAINSGHLKNQHSAKPMSSKNHFNRLRERYVFYAAIGIVSFIFILSRYSNTPETPPGKAESEYDLIPYNLATIDAGQPIAKSDRNIIKYEKLLNQIAFKYIEDKLRLANMVVHAQELLREAGITVSLFQIMEGLDQTVYKSSAPIKLSEIIAMYCTVRKAGDSHEDAILNIKAFLKTFGIK